MCGCTYLSLLSWCMRWRSHLVARPLQAAVDVDDDLGGEDDADLLRDHGLGDDDIFDVGEVCHCIVAVGGFVLSPCRSILFPSYVLLFTSRI
jgi:hypothetical protein